MRSDFIHATKKTLLQKVPLTGNEPNIQIHTHTLPFGVISTQLSRTTAEHRKNAQHAIHTTTARSTYLPSPGAAPSCSTCSFVFCCTRGSISGMANLVRSAT